MSTQAFTSISERLTPSLLALSLSLSFVTVAPELVFAQEAAEGGQDRTLIPEADDFVDTPYTAYGSFNEEEEEAADTKFFQFGRFFGVSVGAGFEGATGNRGVLWQGGFPAANLKFHYWFDFNFALDLGVLWVNHMYEAQVPEVRANVSMLQLGTSLKYYIDTTNLSAAITFANPYILAGIGSYTKTDFDPQRDTAPDRDTKFGLNLGAGLEFPIVPKKSYFTFEGRFHSVNFADSTDGTYSGASSVPRLPDLTGYFYTVVGSVLFTW